MAAISTIRTATDMAATIAPLPAPLDAAYRARAQPQPRRQIGMVSPLIHTRKPPHSTPRQAACGRYESLRGCGEGAPTTSTRDRLLKATVRDEPPQRDDHVETVGGPQ